MWQFAEAVRGLADGCLRARHPGHRRQRQLLQPDRRRPRSCPTPVVGVLGVIDDVAPPHADRASAPTASRCSCSARPATSSAGSEWAHVVHGHLGGLPPQVDLAARAARSAELLVDGRRATGCVDAAHDLSDGGLAQALVESCLRDGVGARGLRCPTARPVRRAVQRVGRPGRRRGARRTGSTDLAGPRRVVRRAGHAARHAPAATRSRCTGLLDGRRRRAPRRPRGHPARPLRLAPGVAHRPPPRAALASAIDHAGFRESPEDNDRTAMLGSDRRCSRSRSCMINWGLIMQRWGSWS